MSIFKSKFFDHKTEKNQMGSAYEKRINMQAAAAQMSAGMSTLFGNAYNGQTISGGMDIPEVTELDYYTLRERSWTMMAKDELASMIIRRLVLFTVGTGLKLQCEPMFHYLHHLGVNFSDEESKKLVDFLEDSYRIQTKSKIMSDVSKEKTFQKIVATAFYNALVGGDCLIMLNVVDGYTKIQLVDGANIADPSVLSADIQAGISVIFNGEKTTRKIPDGHIVKDGVEIDANGCHVGYYVMQISERPALITAIDAYNIIPTFVPAYGKKTGRRTAWLLYGSEYRLGNTRGMPMLGVVLEKAQLLRRYSRSEVLNAEISAKMLGSVEHGNSSTGLNPIQPKVVSRNRADVAPVLEQGYSSLSGDQIVENYAKMTGGQFVNLGRDQKLSKFDTSRPPANFGEFYDANAKYICAALDVPWEVALMVFKNNFSASRMAAKLFEGGALAKWRQELSDSLYRPHYNMFFSLTVLQSEFRLPKYFEALISENHMILDAYTNARFIGKLLPHVDPLKEANTLKVLKEIDARSMTTMAEETYGEDYSDTVPQIRKDQELLKKNHIKSADDTEENNGNIEDADDTSKKKQ